jgi:hypothetical protein
MKCLARVYRQAVHHGWAGAADVTSWVITLKLASVQGRTGHDRDVGGVVSARHQDMANPRLVVAGIERDNILDRASRSTSKSEWTF